MTTIKQLSIDDLELGTTLIQKLNELEKLYAEYKKDNDIVTAVKIQFLKSDIWTEHRKWLFGTTRYYEMTNRLSKRNF